MELKSNVRAISFVKKLLFGETKNLLPFPVRVQKPVPQQNPCVPLPRCTPAKVGIPSASLDLFLRELAQAPHTDAHHALVLRHGNVVCEAHFAPYEGKYWHVSHSLCKTFTGTAIGMLVDDGVLSVDEFLCDIFPENCTLLTSKRMRAVTVKHLLTMRTGVNFREMGSVLDADWLAAFMVSDFLFEPGSAFNYNSMNSYVLSAIVTKKTGVSLYEFLRERLFAPLGFGSVAWETCPRGITKGGWGLYLLPEDLAKIGLFYLQRGMWNGKRLLSEAWIDSATKPDSVHENGEEYGWHLWTHSADGSYMLNGMFGQYVWVMPSLDMVVAVNAGSGNLFTHGPTAGAIAQLFAHVRKADAAGSFEENPRDAQALQYTLAHLRFRKAVPEYVPPVKAPWHKKITDAFVKPLPTERLPGEIPLPPQCEIAAQQAYDINANVVGLLPFVISAMADHYSKGISRVSFCVRNGQFQILWTESGVTQTLPVGFETPAVCELNFGGNIFVSAISGVFTTDEDDHMVLKLTVNLLETTSTRLIKFFFLPDELRIRLAETPEVEYVANLLQQTNPDFMKINTGIFKDVEYLQYRLDKFCVPALTGKPQSEQTT